MSDTPKNSLPVWARNRRPPRARWRRRCESTASHPRTEARLAARRPARWPPVPARPRDTAGAPAPHRLRRGALPERGRVLGRRHRHRHAHGRRLHARVPFLPREDGRAPARARSRGASPPGGGGGAAGARLHRGHQRGSRRSPGRRRWPLRRGHPEAQGDPRAPGRGPHPRLPRRRRGGSHGRARRPGRVREQHRDGAPPHPGRARRARRLRPDARSPGPDAAASSRGW